MGQFIVSEIILRKVKKSELSEVVQFLKDHWKTDHIFVKNPGLLVWQHQSQVEDELNIVAAFDSETGKIFAFHGFIPVSRFDRSLPDGEISLAIWKALPHPSAAALGIQTQFFLEKTLRADTISAIGLEDVAKKLYKAIRYEVGQLDHFYILNPMASSAILTKNAVHSFMKPFQESIAILPLTDCDPDKWVEVFESYNCKYAPTKSFEYFMDRYVRHPIYSYQCYAIEVGGQPMGIVASRVCRAMGAESLRLIDVVFKERLDWLAVFTSKLLMASRAEYADFYNHGLKDLVIETGWNLREGSTIIPNYFEPFEMRNIDLDYAYRNNTKRHFVLVKGDGDQDRPSVVPDPIS